MSKLPKSTDVVETLVAKADAVDTVDRLIKRNFELEEIFEALQPLLYQLSIKLYGDDDSPRSLQEIIDAGVMLLGGTKGVTLQ